MPRAWMLLRLCGTGTNRGYKDDELGTGTEKENRENLQPCKQALLHRRVDSHATAERFARASQDSRSTGRCALHALQTIWTLFKAGSLRLKSEPSTWRPTSNVKRPSGKRSWRHGRPSRKPSQQDTEQKWIGRRWNCKMNG